MARGTVKWFNPEKGYGFIQPDDHSKDVFVHRSKVAGLGRDEGLEPDERVEYEVQQGTRGLEAVDVVRIDEG